MPRLLLSIVLFVHGFIHLIGFAKAFGAGDALLSRDISRPLGLAWLCAALLLQAAAVIQLFRSDTWWMPALAGALLSQALIVMAWSDASWGTIANAIVLVAAVAGFGSWRFERRYRHDVAEQLTAQAAGAPALITQQDLAPLPLPVQRYLQYVGVVNRPRVSNAFIEFDGKMREKGKNWFAFHSEQHNFFRDYRRLFFMKGTLTGVTVPGYHAYGAGNASMEVKPFGMIPVVDLHGKELFRAETVTLLNDICLLAPAALLDPRITWEAMDDSTARVFLQNEDVRVSATLYFNEKNELVNFISDDRFDVNSKARYRFSTPVRDYRDFGGYKLPAYGEAAWTYPDGLFTYGVFKLKKVQYNVER